MTLTRRALAAVTLSAAMAPTAFAAQTKPIVIGHRGCSGERPEHTPMAYRRAIEQGADYIEPDLVATKDGHLVARHENEIGGTTDVAGHAEFAGRKTTKVIDGESIEGWFTEDFTLAELKTLRCRERLPQLRPENAKFDGQEAICTFEEVVAIARAAGRPVGVYPEMKHPTHFAKVGLPLEDRLAGKLKALDLNSKSALVFVQCFEVGALKTIRQKTKARLIQLIDAEGGPADLPDLKYWEMLIPDGLKGIAAYADGIGPNRSLVVPDDGEALMDPTTLVARAHAAGLAVHPWTVRAENYFLPRTLRRGDDLRAHGDVAAVYRALFDAGVDGLFSDFPGLAVAARGA
ncbi:glycerophosphoryl diester phosphodiesterase [Caulobacter ginsengisoli]|uniref:glycerophosphodiester phosphodiesterase n=1 Tax=Caulobacter ginsengisoli TaxID=400775 RepID=A0ABU0IW66_9CAUL|nr:glycerophosphodiester phosphodiesterase [Caulobacter ginsengisoli]MDQ0465167.1 glycerophosphoryl diester phosphodiesterase [Caulobacter ginsengisoli]